MLLGRPPPRISWWSGDTIVDALDCDSDIPKVKENELYLPLNRENAAGLSCRASNTHLTPPIVASLEIELYCKYLFSNLIINSFRNTSVCQVIEICHNRY